MACSTIADVPKVIALVKWPVFGALFAGGALAVVHYLGRDRATELGAAAGDGFARGVAQAQKELAAAVSGWGSYR